MNPYLLLVAMLAMAAAAFGGFRLGVDHERAGQVDKQAVVAAAVEAANASAATAIAAIKPKYTTIQSEVRREIQTNTVFSDCKLPAASLRLVDQALAPGSPGAAGGSQLPPAHATE